MWLSLVWAASKLIKGPYMFVEQCLNNYECITVSISSENSSLGLESNHRFKYMHVVSECDQMWLFSFEFCFYYCDTVIELPQLCISDFAVFLMNILFDISLTASIYR